VQEDTALVQADGAALGCLEGHAGNVQGGRACRGDPGRGWRRVWWLPAGSARRAGWQV